MDSPAEYVFSPGAGATPPALTGRGEEQSVLSRCLAALANGKAPPHDVVLVGPRGNGKTVLINWFAATCGMRVDALTLTPSDVGDRQALIEALAPRRGLARILLRKVAIASVGSAEWAAPDDTRTLAGALIARCGRRPLAVLLDEAHTLDVKVGSALLNASQQVRAAAPFLLVLAGTPGLPRHLDAMDASFWGRLADGLLGIGCLSAGAAQEALAKPLLDHDVSIDADALAMTVQHSQCYPYFIQLWGDALWKQHLVTGVDQLNAGHVAAALPDVTKRVTNYYQGRAAELETSGLMASAAAVAPLFGAGPNDSASNQEIDDALVGAGIKAEGDRLRAREGLNDLGYIWRPPGQLPPVVWRSGIPSLMTHVLAHARGEGAPTREIRYERTASSRTNMPTTSSRSGKRTLAAQGCTMNVRRRTNQGLRLMAVRAKALLALLWWRLCWSGAADEPWVPPAASPTAAELAPEVERVRGLSRPLWSDLSVECGRTCISNLGRRPIDVFIDEKLALWR